MGVTPSRHALFVPPPPASSPGLAGGLRAWLEDGVAEASNDLPRLVSYDAPAPHGAMDPAGLLLERMTFAAFRLVVTGISLRRPFDDVVGALSADSDAAAILDALGGLRRTERAALRAAICARAEVFHARMGAIPPALLPATRHVVTVPLAGGRVVLRATADLSLRTTRPGPSPAAGAVTLVRIRRAGDQASDPARALRFLALLETVRSGTPPRHLVDLDPDTGARTLVPTTLSALREAVHDTLHLLSPTSAESTRERLSGRAA